MCQSLGNRCVENVFPIFWCLSLPFFICSCRSIGKLRLGWFIVEPRMPSEMCFTPLYIWLYSFNPQQMKKRYYFCGKLLRGWIHNSRCTDFPVGIISWNRRFSFLLERWAGVADVQACCCDTNINYSRVIIESSVHHMWFCFVCSRHSFHNLLFFLLSTYFVSA